MDAWLVAEAVPERLDLKKEILGRLDRVAAPDAFLAGNSSSYPTSQFIDRVEHSERVLNTHCSMPLLQNGVDIMSDGHTDCGIMTFLERELPGYDGKPRICELGRAQITDLMVKGAWTRPARLQLFEHALAPPADLPVREVVAASRILTDLAPGRPTVVHHYL
ncbi:acetoacetate decarboxylase family protein [Streptomyces sp. NPDC055243]|uniref:acetoacetate decarboxylase family protein n=1 Tax=Streptomyces sp. NPDC055243 TaxID=3365720 RepID=UPI0037D468CC